MKFKAAGREFVIGWNHAMLVFGLSMLIGFAAVGIAVVYTASAGMEVTPERLGEGTSAITAVLGVVAEPLLPFLLLLACGYLGMKKDVQLCRSLAGADAVILVFFSLLGMGAGFLVGVVSAEIAVPYLIGWLGGLLSIGAGAAITYLWLLIFINPDRERAKRAAKKALIMAGLIFLLNEIAVVLLGYSTGLLMPLDISPGTVLWVAAEFLLGFVLLYHLEGKTDAGDIRLFAAMYLGPHAFYMLADAGLIMGGDYASVIGAAEAVAELALVYLLKDSLKTF